jgi:hypothetical protein
MSIVKEAGEWLDKEPRVDGKGEKKMSEENLLIRSKGALADSSDELPIDADVYATYSVFTPELMEKFMEKPEEKHSDGSS